MISNISSGVYGWLHGIIAIRNKWCVLVKFICYTKACCHSNILNIQTQIHRGRCNYRLILDPCLMPSDRLHSDLLIDRLRTIDLILSWFCRCSKTTISMYSSERRQLCILSFYGWSLIVSEVVQDACSWQRIMLIESSTTGNEWRSTVTTEGYRGTARSKLIRTLDYCWLLSNRSDRLIRFRAIIFE